jgi:hypothetical protein
LVIIYAGLTGLSRTVPPSRWGWPLDPDFVLYIVDGLRRIHSQRVTIDIILISGYRTYAQQARLYAARSTRETARPGLSQHEYGYAIDVQLAFPRSSTSLMAVLGAFGIPYEQNPARYSQAILTHFFSDLLYLRSRDPGHMAFYSDQEWHQALAEAGYFGGGDVSPQYNQLTPVADPWDRNAPTW